MTKMRVTVTKLEITRGSSNLRDFDNVLAASAPFKGVPFAQKICFSKCVFDYFK